MVTSEERRKKAKRQAGKRNAARKRKEKLPTNIGEGPTVIRVSPFKQEGVYCHQNSDAIEPSKKTFFEIEIFPCPTLEESDSEKENGKLQVEVEYRLWKTETNRSRSISKGWNFAKWDKLSGKTWRGKFTTGRPKNKFFIDYDNHNVCEDLTLDTNILIQLKLKIKITDYGCDIPRSLDVRGFVDPHNKKPQNIIGTNINSTDDPIGVPTIVVWDSEPKQGGFKESKFSPDYIDGTDSLSGIVWEGNILLSEPEKGPGRKKRTIRDVREKNN